MLVASWNTNGLRACVKNGFHKFIEQVQPDILCLQETRCQPEDFQDDLPGYHKFWNPASKKGYSGTAVFSRQEPINVFTGIGLADLDLEGRALTCEYENYYIVSVYVPNSQRDLARLPVRGNWDREFAKFIRRLDSKKPVVVSGDFNVSHHEIDLANPKTNRKNAGFTPQERQGFTDILGDQFLDSFRCLHQEGERYSWWSYRFNARARNIGWRLDYVVISKILQNKLQDADILDEVSGSDHCPVVATIDL
jgi:exodeoxyribonuclease III